MTDHHRKKEWTSIPTLPCASIEATLSFWEMLGFAITYKQTRPYQYGVVERGGAAVHFAALKGMETDERHYHGCLVAVPDAAEVYREFSQRMKTKLGRVPHAGLPRISRMKPGTTRFTLTDVSGNSIIFVSLGEKDQETWEKADDGQQSPLRQAIARAIRFRDYKEDEKAAAKVLDVALKKAADEDRLTMAEALIIRMDLASLMGDRDFAGECDIQLSRLDLPEEEIKRLKQQHGATM
ncbi:hypothetical protein [Chitinophaga varians]|uniref:hypothetical protein n=1 Tax=Chitinophaga varians TaxID=2202339 RepID=UPI00165EC1B8|nr:hypothetical protein [Chitinophaga varians]MBC9909430.1 hypothetical protein [Chitinophaga varians]